MTDYTVHLNKLREQLGFRTYGFPLDATGRWEDISLPAQWHWHDMYATVPGTYTLVLKASEQPHRGTGKHRLFVECKCGRLIPVGRLNQHMPSCKGATE